LDQFSCVQKGGWVVGFDPGVDDFSVAGSRDEIVADAFDLVRGSVDVEFLGHCEDAAKWVGSDNNGVWEFLFEFSADSGDGSSCSDANDDCVYFSFGLVDDLFG